MYFSAACFARIPAVDRSAELLGEGIEDEAVVVVLIAGQEVALVVAERGSALNAALPSVQVFHCVNINANIIFWTSLDPSGHLDIKTATRPYSV